MNDVNHKPDQMTHTHTTDLSVKLLSSVKLNIILRLMIVNDAVDTK